MGTEKLADEILAKEGFSTVIAPPSCNFLVDKLAKKDEKTYAIDVTTMSRKNLSTNK